MEFLPVFESLLAKMELAGMGKSDRDLRLTYLALIPPGHRPDVLKVRRSYPLSDCTTSATRGVETWREAHRVLVKLEEADAGSKAFVAAVGGTERHRGGEWRRREEQPRA